MYVIRMSYVSLDDPYISRSLRVYILLYLVSNLAGPATVGFDDLFYACNIMSAWDMAISFIAILEESWKIRRCGPTERRVAPRGAAR